MDNDAPVVKNVIYAGRQFVPLEDGSKVHFHFQTWKIGKKRVLLDDSRLIGKKEPMVMVIGRKFKLEVWEYILKNMAVGEVASFKVKKEMLFCYPFISKSIRELDQDVKNLPHKCAVTIQSEGIGYDDLDDYMNNPTDLEFIFELLKVEKNNEYEKDLWQLDERERLEYIPHLREKGNRLYAEKNYEEAEKAYSLAVGICEQLMVRERVGDEEWVHMNKIKIPILLNYTQCRLIFGDYYAVIEHCTTVLKHDENNEKALFRRGKAHIGAWNPDKAEEDFNKLKEINPAMTATVDKELKYIKKLRQEKAERDRELVKNMFKDNKC